MKERRKSKRRPVVATFSLFVVVPKKGVHRLQVHDVSEHGLGFDFDTEGETLADFPLKNGESIDLHFFLNQSLYIPLKVKVARIDQVDDVRRVGAELMEKNSLAQQAFTSFITTLDKLAEAGRINT